MLRSSLSVSIDYTRLRADDVMHTVVRAGLLSGKLSQVSRTLLVVRAAPRGFAGEHWKALEERLLAWKEGLTGIQNVLAAAVQSGGTVALASSLNPQEQSA